MNHSLYKGAAFLLLSEAFFVLMGTQVRAVSETLPNEMIVFFRNLFGILIILPLMYRPGQIRFKTQKLALHLLRGIAGVSAMYCFFYAIAHLPLANAMILKMSAPLFVPLIAWLWLKEQVTGIIVFLIAIGFVGVMLIIKPDFQQFDPVAWIALAGGVFAALAKTTVRKLTATEAPATIVFYFAVTGFLVSVIPAIIAWKTPQPDQWLALVLLGLFASGGQIMMTQAYQSAPASRISPFGYSSILFASVTGWWLWGEYLDGWSWFGAALIALSGILLLRVKSDTKPQTVANPVG